MAIREIVTRGHLPHWYQPGHAHFITYRLAGTIPTKLLREWRLERERFGRHSVPTGKTFAEHQLDIHRQFFLKYDMHLDETRDRCWLADRAIAAAIRENLYHHNGQKYQLLAYCVMPNHVHALLQPFGLVHFISDSIPSTKSIGEASSFAYVRSDEIADARSPLTSIMHGLKSYTANLANSVLGRRGQFWQHESYDYWVRDLDELERIVQYIMQNPVRAGLCRSPTEWEFSSAADRFRLDGSDCGIVGWLCDDWHRQDR